MKLSPIIATMLAMQMETVHSTGHRRTTEQFDHEEEEDERFLRGQPTLSSRIVGGELATRSYPYTTALHYWTKNKLDYQFCGGILILPDVVLTAAHCEPDRGDKAVARTDLLDLTKTDTEMFRIIEISNHPNYDDDTDEHDVALWKLDSSSKAPIVMLNGDDSIPAPGETVRVMGWGTLWSDGPSSDALLEVDLDMISNELCQKQYQPLWGKGAITDDMMCAWVDGEAKDSCQGDSGGPLIVPNDSSPEQDLLVGVVSWGEGCADEKYAGAYSRVSDQIKWIREEACEMTSEKGACKIRINTSSASLSSETPSQMPSSISSQMPSSVPTQMPSSIPSQTPSSISSQTPSSIPSHTPSNAPSQTLSDVPSATPSLSLAPTQSAYPSAMPSAAPSLSPSTMPSSSVLPSAAPSQSPSKQPSSQPSGTPSASSMPSHISSATPSQSPEQAPLVLMTKEQLDPEDGTLGAWKDGGSSARLYEDYGEEDFGFDLALTKKNKKAATGMYSFRLRDNRGSSSAMELELPDVPKANCAKIRVTFQFMVESFEQNDAFVLEYAQDTIPRTPTRRRRPAHSQMYGWNSNYGGGGRNRDWTRVETWVMDPSENWIFENTADSLLNKKVAFSHRPIIHEGLPHTQQTVEIDTSSVTSSDHFSIRLRCDASSRGDRVFFDDVQIECLL